MPTDPSLLLTGAGVVPFRDFIEGRAKPSERRVVTCQKCVRDNDTERVGRTARHLTFFEMLGNFAFGDYYKREAILWGWEFLTELMGLDGERLWGAIYEEDEEAGGIWQREVGLPEERIVALGRDNNWWGPVAETGACGPCSEVYYDLGPEFGCGKPDCAPGCDCDRFLEIWNYVFTEYYRHEDGSFSALPTKNIDTGMGLERLAVVVQEKTSCFETDLLRPLVALAGEISATKGVGAQFIAPVGGRDKSRPYKNGDAPESDAALRIIADHARSFTFMITDGILPSNVGRGYVLRRLMRRAITRGWRHGIEKPFLALLVPRVVELMSSFYPELVSAREHVERVARAEEQQFRETVGTGKERLYRILAEFRRMGGEGQGGRVLQGQQVFPLYATYGLPVPVIVGLAEEEGFSVDEDGLRQAIEAHRQASRGATGQTAGGGKAYADVLHDMGLTPFLGYEDLSLRAKVVAILEGGERIRVSSSESGDIILDQTPFYPESGGQVGDSGRLEGETAVAEVLGTFYGAEGLIVHRCRLVEGEIREGDLLDAQVDTARRAALRRSHTATHLLHFGLRQVVGRHVAQSGSLVEADGFRFDFSHFGALSPEELEQVEALVNEKILGNSPVRTTVMPLEQAQESGAMALFGEKYGSTVRVVEVGDFSKELCGGTHVASTGEIGSFRLLSEGSIGSGLRRATAATGLGVRQAWLADEACWTDLMGALQASSKEEVMGKISSLKDSLAAVSGQLERYRTGATSRAAVDLAKGAAAAGGFRLVLERVESEDGQFLEQLCDQVSAKTSPSLVLLAGSGKDAIPLVCKLSPELGERGLHAGRIVAEVAAAGGGKGGGRPLFAKGAASDASGLTSALRDMKKRLQEGLKG